MSGTKQLLGAMAIILAILVSAQSASGATIVLDQNQPSATVYMAAFDQTDLAQSFQQSLGNIAGAGILLQPGIGSTDNVVIEVWSALPNAGGALLATGSGVGTQGTWFDVFWSPVFLTPGTTYYLVFSGNTTLGIAGDDVSNPYPFGQVYANPGFGSFPTYDYTFRTFADLDAIPEPATLLLLGTGLAAAGARRRMKKRS